MNREEQPLMHHLTAQNRFEIQIETSRAVLEYTIHDGHMTITHTFVPDSLRGRGIAGLLAKAAFQYAEKQSLKVIPQCSYIATYAKRHPEIQALLA